MVGLTNDYDAWIHVTCLESHGCHHLTTSLAINLKMNKYTRDYALVHELIVLVFKISQDVGQINAFYRWNSFK